MPIYSNRGDVSPGDGSDNMGTRVRARHHLFFLVANVLFQSAIASFKTVVCSTNTTSERSERVGFSEGKFFRGNILGKVTCVQYIM